IAKLPKTTTKQAPARGAADENLDRPPRARTGLAAATLVAHRSGLRLVHPYAESGQRVRSETVRQRHVRGIAPAGDQDPSDARRVVARIEYVPAPPPRNTSIQAAKSIGA